MPSRSLISPKASLSRVAAERLEADVLAVRRENLRYLASTYFTQLKDAATRFGLSPSFFSQMIGRTPTRHVTDTTARHVEAVMKLDPGWLDDPHPLLTTLGMSIASINFGQVFDSLPPDTRMRLINDTMLYARDDMLPFLRNCINDLKREAEANADQDDSVQA